MDGDELEEPCEDRGNEIENLVQGRDIQPAQDGAEEECRNPEQELSSLAQGAVAADDASGGGVDTVFFLCSHDKNASLFC